MADNQDTQVLEQWLARLKGWLPKLSTEIRAFADDLEGNAPEALERAEKVAGDLTRFNNNYRKFCSELYKDARALGIKKIPPDNVILALEDLAVILDELKKLSGQKSKFEGDADHLKKVVVQMKGVKALEPQLEKYVETIQAECDKLLISIESSKGPEQVQEIRKKFDGKELPLAALLAMLKRPESPEEADFIRVKDWLGFEASVAVTSRKLVLPSINKQSSGPTTTPQIPLKPAPRVPAPPTPAPPAAASIKPAPEAPELPPAPSAPVEIKPKFEERPLPKYSGKRSKDIAAILASMEDAYPEEDLAELVMALVKEGKFVEAYWVAARSEKELQGKSFCIPSWPLKALSLVPFYTGRESTIEKSLKDCYEQYDLDELILESDYRGAGLPFLVFASALKASLLPGDTRASLIFRDDDLPVGVEELHELRHKIVECADKGVVFDSSILAKINSEVDWEIQIESVCAEARAWLEHAQTRSILFSVASRAWTEWVKSGGHIHRMLDPVVKNDLSKMDTVAKLAGELGDDKNIERELNSTISKLKLTTRRTRVEARALRQFEGHVKEATEIAKDWLDIHDNETKSVKEDWVRNVRHEWSGVKKSLQEAITSLEGCKECDDPWTCYAESACRQSCMDMSSYLASNPARAKTMYDPDLILRSPLLRMTLWPVGEPRPLGEDWEPLLKDIFFNLSKDELKEEEFFPYLLKRGRLDLANDLLGSTYVGTEANRMKLLDMLLKRKEEIDIQLNKEAEEARFYVEDATLKDILEETSRSTFMTTLETIGKGNNWNLEVSQEKIERIYTIVEEKKQALIGDIRKRLDSLVAPEEEKKKLLNALANDDLSTANEYLTMLEDSGRIETDEDADDELAWEFFRHFDGISDYLYRVGPRAPGKLLKATFSEKSRLAGIDLSRMTGTNKREANELLDLWFDLKNGYSENVTKVQLKNLLSRLGFREPQIEKSRLISKDQVLLNLSTGGKVNCPVHEFGSSANRRYFLFCIWNRPSEENLLSDIKEYCTGKPSIVLYFGRLSRKAQEELAQVSPGNSLSFIIIDEVVLLHLCTVRGNRGRVLFSDTLPISGKNPFTPDVTANVPPEIFFGREREMEKVQDPQGPGFIFGGRQFGKSALLRNVKLQFNDESQGRLAIYMDLKARGIGYDRRINEIWQIIAEALKDHRIIPMSATNIYRKERIFEYVQKWLGEDPDRRLLLLLDEADEFLRQDALGDPDLESGQFVNVSTLKGWRDATNGRFKIVFAGLHNVQRFWRISNQPLAHLGSPLSIGPLHPRDAMQLIRKPFQAVGYEFENNDVIIRILTHTNYQPCLIQIVCSRLFDYLTSRRSRGELAKFPPYIIRGEDVDKIYISQDLRGKIKNRFELTLELDPWYKLIAYIFAYSYIIGELDHEGMKDSDVEREVSYWWPDAMKDAPRDWVLGLLEEMIGLGLLVRSEGGRFRLRGPNVVRLLGTEDEIAKVLEAFSGESPDWERNPQLNRRRLGNNLAIRSPLTLFQEALLFENRNGTIALSGSIALGMDKLIDALLECSCDGNSGRSVRVLKSDNLTQARHEIAQLIKEAGRGVHAFLMTPKRLDTGMLLDTIHFINSQKGRDKFARLVLVFGPDNLAGWIRSIPELERLELEEAGLQFLFLRPWDKNMLKCWCEDLDLNIHEEARGRILSLTGGWPLYIERFVELLKANDNDISAACDSLEMEVFEWEDGMKEMQKRSGFSSLWHDAQICINTAKELGHFFEQEALSIFCEGEMDEEGFLKSIFFLDNLSFFLTEEGKFIINPPILRLIDK